MKRFCYLFVTVPLILSACGISAGPVAIGTTGFLHEHNRARMVSESISADDRRSLAQLADGAK